MNGESAFRLHDYQADAKTELDTKFENIINKRKISSRNLSLSVDIEPLQKDRSSQSGDKLETIVSPSSLFKQLSSEPPVLMDMNMFMSESMKPIVGYYEVSESTKVFELVLRCILNPVCSIYKGTENFLIFGT